MHAHVGAEPFLPSKVAKGRTAQPTATHQNRLGGGELPYWAVLGRSWVGLGAVFGRLEGPKAKIKLTGGY